jgi:FKBP-type peptidyl-prolyl cis-trans isomerase 2
VSTPLCVIFQIWVPSVDVEMGVTLRELGMSVESRSSVAGFTYGYRMMFCKSGVAAVVVGAVPRVSNLKVPGWDKGLVGQTVGSRILLVVPPADGYGAKDTMVFVVDILAAT